MAFSFFKSKKEEKVEDDIQEKVQELPIEQVEVNEDQPRQVFSEESIAELAETIQSHVLLQPIIVRPIGGNKYQIIAGERRYRAIKKLNWQKIPTIVKKMDEKEAASMAVIENLQREGLTAIEEAESYRKLMDLNQLTQLELARAIGKSQAFVANKLRLLKLSPLVQRAILQRKISERHGRSIVSLPEKKQVEILKKIVDKKLSVKETEKIVAQLKTPPVKKEKKKTNRKGTALDWRLAENTIKESIKLASENGIELKRDHKKGGERAVSEYVLELKGITKIFPGVKALNNVQFQLKPGEVHALMGENGAGKSTFIKVITGVHKAEEGEMFLNGKKVDFKGPKDAQAAGIAAVYQHPTSYPHLTVAENIFMGHEIIKNKMIQWKAMNAEANKLLQQLDADFDATDEMGTLSVAQQQMVEIAKAMSTNAKIIILDEPTAALTKSESEKLYTLVDKLKEEGVSIIFISHRFEDMYRLASRVTVFRDSQYIGTYNVNGITNADLIKAMVGREINDLFPKPEVKLGQEMLRVENLSRTGFFKDVSFSVRAGEIVGLTGLVGAGRTETVEAICGITHPDSGKVYLEGKEIHIKRPSDAMEKGIILLPEDRQKEGLIRSWGLGRNVTLPTISKYAKHGINDEKTERDLAKKLLEEVDTKAVDIFQPASSLSGGNQQKVVVAKALSQEMKVVIMDEPTKGVDVGAKAEIYAIMGDLAKRGYAIILISSEMPEILGMSDRIVVMCNGRKTGELNRDEATQERILELAMEKGTGKGAEK